MFASRLLVLLIAPAVAGCVVKPGACRGGRVLVGDLCILADAGRDAAPSDAGPDARSDAGCTSAADCTEPAHASATCAGGACGFECDPGHLDCDGAPETGCEASDGDPATCGRCGNGCTAPSNAVPTCTAGACGWSCAEDFGDCNGAAADGCEDWLGSPIDCGGCGTRCSAAEICAGETCGPLTVVGLTRFGGPGIELLPSVAAGDRVWGTAGFAPSATVGTDTTTYTSLGRSDIMFLEFDSGLGISAPPHQIGADANDVGFSVGL